MTNKNLTLALEAAHQEIEGLKRHIDRLKQEKQVGLDTIDRLNGIISKKKEKIDWLETSLAQALDTEHSLNTRIKLQHDVIEDLQNRWVAPELAFHNLFILICNWESSIIERTWPMAEFGTLTTHFQAKFSGFCNLHGNYASANAILSFYFSLSDHYKKDLCCQMMKDINIRDQWRKDFSY
jgi:hypothetical protein